MYNTCTIQVPWPVWILFLTPVSRGERKMHWSNKGKVLALRVGVKRGWQERSHKNIVQAAGRTSECNVFTCSALFVFVNKQLFVNKQYTLEFVSQSFWC